MENVIAHPLFFVNFASESSVLICRWCLTREESPGSIGHFTSESRSYW